MLASFRGRSRRRDGEWRCMCGNLGLFHLLSGSLLILSYLSWISVPWMEIWRACVISFTFRYNMVGAVQHTSWFSSLESFLDALGDARFLFCKPDNSRLGDRCTFVDSSVSALRALLCGRGELAVVSSLSESTNTPESRRPNFCLFDAGMIHYVLFAQGQ